MKKLFGAISGFMLLVSLVPGVSSAQTVSASANVQAQLDAITSLNQQIKALQAQTKGLIQTRQETVSQLVATLKAGATGDQVKILQTLLAANPGIYPEGLITGLFGPATARAVKRFQKENGLEQAGIVGPKTLKKLNELFGDIHVSFEDASSSENGEKENKGKGSENRTTSTSNEHRPCVIVPPGHLIAPGWLRKNDGVRPIVPACQTIPPGIWKKINATSTPTSTVDTVAPILSIIHSSVTTSAATITWMTNENADSQVMYGVTSAYGSSTILNTALMTSHSQMITGLNAATTYHFQVKSKDASGNMATSADMTFTTSALVDTTAPVVSEIVAGPSSSTAMIVWATNEAATGKVYYGTISPLDITSSSTLAVLNGAFTTAHSINLTGLTASTTYYYVVESTDASSNKTTSSQRLFITLQ